MRVSYVFVTYVCWIGDFVHVIVANSISLSVLLAEGKPKAAYDTCTFVLRQLGEKTGLSHRKHC